MECEEYLLDLLQQPYLNQIGICFMKLLFARGIYLLASAVTVLNIFGLWSPRKGLDFWIMGYGSELFSCVMVYKSSAKLINLK